MLECTTMIDCHCHITANEFDQDREKLLEDAKKIGVKAIVAVCEFPSDVQDVIELSERHEKFIYPCIGVHPVQIASDNLKAVLTCIYYCSIGEKQGLEKHAIIQFENWGNESVKLKHFEEIRETIYKYKKQIVGIGEVGLDFTPHYIKNSDDKEIQRDVFRKQIRLAKELDLPVNVHSRSAGRPVIDLLIEEGAEKVVLHAFDGKPSVALRGVEAGFYFSVPPSIIRSEQKQKLVSKIPLENLLLETDAPALGPEKMQRNVPSNIMVSCKEISRIKEVSLEEVVDATTKNAVELFVKLS